MRRDPRLRQLSSEHHRALVLAREVRRGAIDGEALLEIFARELAPHFAIEERALLPVLARAGRRDLVMQTIAEHDLMRAAVARGELERFADLLVSHVRFEERVLFPVCEELGELDALTLPR